MTSGKHNLSKRDAILTMSGAMLQWKEGDDLFADREQYRNALEEKPSKKKRSADDHRPTDEDTSIVPRSKRKCGGERSGSTPHNLDTILNQALKTQLINMIQDDDLTADIHDSQQKTLSSSSAGGMQLREPLADVVVTSDQLKHVRDSLIRADSALSGSKTQCLEMARRLHNEQLAVRDAIIAVKRMSES